MTIASCLFVCTSVMGSSNQSTDCCSFAHPNSPSCVQVAPGIQSAACHVAEGGAWVVAGKD